MTDIDTLEVPENAIILIKDPDGTWFDHDDQLADFCKMVNEKHPNNLVVVLSGDLSMETLSEEEARTLLLDLIEHQEKREGR